MLKGFTLRPAQLAPGPQGRFGIIEIVAVSILILGTLWLAAHSGVNLYCTLHGMPAESLPQQIVDVFIFAVIECFALVLLHARGLLPYLDAGIFKSIVDNTIGYMPKLLDHIIKSFCNRSNN
jgi:hypothetical protein